MPQAHHFHYWLSGFAAAMALGWWWFHWQTSVAWILFALLALYDGHTLNEWWAMLKADREKLRDLSLRQFGPPEHPSCRSTLVEEHDEKRH